MKKIIFVFVFALALTPVAHAADQYSYVQAVKTPSGTQTVSGGPFDSSAACYADLQAKGTPTQEDGPCSCGVPIAQQGGACPGYAAPAQSQASTDTIIDPLNTGSTVNGSTGAITNPATASPDPGVPVSAAPAASAGGYVQVVTIPGLTDSQPNQGGLANFLNNLYKYLVGLAATLAVIEIIWGGLKIATQRDSISAHSEGVQKIQHALFGLVLVLSPAIVFSIINPSILNLSLNIPPLDLSTPNTSPAVQTQNSPLSQTDTQVREAAGGQVLSSFTVQSNISPKTLGDTLDAKQAECTQTSNGLGVILPNPTLGGGAYQYVCQTCPPNTKTILYPKGKAGPGPRGACQ